MPTGTSTPTDVPVFFVILRDISMYRVLTEGQLLRLYPGKQAAVRNLLGHLVRQGRICQRDGLYCAAPECAEEVDRGLLAAVWVLVDFIDRVEYHAAGEFPAKIIFIADGEVYEIVHAQSGKEILLTLPSLLPKRKRRQSSEFLLDTFNAAMEQYAKSNPLPRYRHCVICFALVYCKDLPDRRVKDYDNLELKQLLDVAASYLLEDDGGLLCDAYQTTELGENDCTRISIMDSGLFPEWLEKRRAALQSLKDL